jgi:hypothetical protein
VTAAFAPDVRLLRVLRVPPVLRDADFLRAPPVERVFFRALEALDPVFRAVVFRPLDFFALDLRAPPAVDFRALDFRAPLRFAVRVALRAAVRFAPARRRAAFFLVAISPLRCSGRRGRAQDSRTSGRAGLPR